MTHLKDMQQEIDLTECPYDESSVVVINLDHTTEPAFISSMIDIVQTGPLCGEQANDILVVLYNRYEDLQRCIPNVPLSAPRIFFNAAVATLPDTPDAVGGLVGITSPESDCHEVEGATTSWGGQYLMYLVKVIGWESQSPVVMEGVANWDGQAEEQMVKGKPEDEDGKLPGESAASVDDEILSSDNWRRRSIAEFQLSDW
ncbi:hypothetical protein JB92DRAFT_2828293 [Gautieria morchelliformis]|nr:hypothetical protein JB92DRAFT_2828293 [Gautieria morchelliformis]